VWRLGLLYKILQNQNIGSRLYNIIKDMHKHTEASIKMGKIYPILVKQGVV
jgi:DNA-binding PadR family transcriptional regulator